jgi:exodeoxyribonuclease-3
MRIVSWNVNGLRAAAKKGFAEWASSEAADILCLQETKASEDQLEDPLKTIPGYTKAIFCSGERKGYSGVATYSKEAPLKIQRGFGADPSFDSEGRIIITSHPGFELLNIYFPNGQKDDGRLKYKLAFYDACLDYCQNLRKNGAEIVICGDFNTAHNEIDLAHPKENESVSGFLRIERDWMDKIESLGYVDTFRHLHSDTREAYTWWSMRTAARGRNVGWRLDYFYITPGLLKNLLSSEILADVQGSDHCPVRLTLSF